MRVDDICLLVAAQPSLLDLGISWYDRLKRLWVYAQSYINAADASNHVFTSIKSRYCGLFRSFDGAFVYGYVCGPLRGFEKD